MLHPNKYPKSQADKTELTKPKTKRSIPRSAPLILVKSMRWNHDLVICIDNPGKSETKRRQTRYVTPIVKAKALAKINLFDFIIITSIPFWDTPT